jgi:C4-dicarboxylate-specific signal transduction histidine kinase
VQSVAVQQVLVNVLRNSIEALSTMPSKDRRIDIGAAPFDRLVEVVVSDNGPGLPEDQRASIFEPFVTTKSQGLGLGLSICRTIVEEHGGSIWVTAREMGGAIVHFTLPARAE